MSSVNVTGTYLFPKFRGVKDLDPSLRRGEELTIEEIWDKILGDNYSLPYCPECHTRLLIMEFHLEYQISNSAIGNFRRSYSGGFIWNTRIANPIVQVDMHCEKCNLAIRAAGTGLHFEKDSYYLETLTVFEKRKVQILWHSSNVEKK